LIDIVSAQDHLSVFQGSIKERECIMSVVWVQILSSEVLKPSAKDAVITAVHSLSSVLVLSQNFQPSHSMVDKVQQKISTCKIGLGLLKTKIPSSEVFTYL